MRVFIRISTLIFVSAILSACVSETVHQQKLDENAYLQSVIKSLEADYERLKADKIQLADRNDSLNQRVLEAIERNKLLQEDLMRARADLERVEKVLADRSAEAGTAMAEMRQEIDRLVEGNNLLQQQLEVELQAREARLAEVQSTYDELVGKLEQEIERGEVRISELKGKLTVNVVDKILFDSGKAALKPAGIKVLQQIGDILNSAVDKNIQVEGHTDNVPISGGLAARYPSNWELSTARATTVLHFLQDKVGVSGERLSAVGYGEYQPISSNATAEGRAENRRIQIVLTAAKKP
ncbi:MAG: OmpA family protein [Deltaproteobacteria bacterium]|nr:OmpA family protein [Deltaproteobacteria bacterium]MDH4007117.1 OmpA family protein [Desulfuromonadales bacterium]